MGFQISKVFAGLFGKREMRILMVGLVRQHSHSSSWGVISYLLSTTPCVTVDVTSYFGPRKKAGAVVV